MPFLMSGMLGTELPSHKCLELAWLVALSLSSPLPAPPYFILCNPLSRESIQGCRQHYFSVLQRLSVTTPWWSPLEAVLVEEDPFTPFADPPSLSLSLSLSPWTRSTCIHEAPGMSPKPPPSDLTGPLLSSIRTRHVQLGMRVW